MECYRIVISFRTSVLTEDTAHYAITMLFAMLCIFSASCRLQLRLEQSLRGGDKDSGS